MSTISFLVCTAALLQQAPSAQQNAPKGLIDGTKLKADYNAAKERVRVMLIFSPS